MRTYNYYDRVAHLYDRTRWLTASVAEDAVDFILNLVNATPNTSFLEPGVGTGLNVLPLVKRGYTVTGIDISQAMLHQFRQKFNQIPPNLTLIHGDASRLPFGAQSFDVVLTVHMIHTVADWKQFLDDIGDLLKPQGFYLNAQWITPPARREFEHYFRELLVKYDVQSRPNQTHQWIQPSDVDTYLCNQGYHSTYSIAKEWMVSNTVAELIGYFKSRAYGFCWRVSEQTFDQVMDEFQAFCIHHYGSLQTMLSSPAKYEFWAYRHTI